MQKLQINYVRDNNRFKEIKMKLERETYYSDIYCIDRLGNEF